MKVKYISLLHLVKDLNQELYNQTKLTDVAIIYLSQLKMALLDLEKFTRELLKTKHKKWLDEQHINESLALLNQVYTQVHNELLHIISQSNKELDKIKSQLSKEQNERFLEINQYLTHLLHIVDLQKKDRVAQILKSRGINGIYQLYQGLLINFVASTQVADPLFGGYLKDNQVVLGGGICGGKVIKWIYLCARNGSPKYPLYCEAQEHDYQDNYAQFRSESTLKLDNQPLLDVVTQIPHLIKPGAFYCIEIRSATAGHALGVRKRHDQVVEYYDPNTGHTFSDEENRTQIALLLGVSEYVLFNNYVNATVYEASVKDENPQHSYFPDRHTLHKAHTKIVSEQDELNIVRELQHLLKRAYASKQAPQTTADTYFSLLLPLVIDSLNYSSAIRELRTILELIKSETLHKAVDDRLSQRLNIVSASEFESALTAKNQALTDYNKQQEDLVQKLNEFRSSAHTLVKQKGDQAAASHSKLTAVATRMSTFSGLLTRLNKTNIPALLNSKPITSAVQFLKDTVSKVTRLFSSKATNSTAVKSILQEVAEEIAQDSAANIPATNSHELNARMELNTVLGALLPVVSSLIARLKNAHEAELTTSGLSYFGLNNAKAKYTLKRGTLSHVHKSLRALHDKVLTEYSDEESASAATFERQLQQLIPIDATVCAKLTAEEIDQNALMDYVDAAMNAQITDSALVKETKQSTAPAEQRGLRADQQQIVASLTTLIDYLTGFQHTTLAAIDAAKQTSPENMSLFHALYCQLLPIETALVPLLETRVGLAAVRLHTDKDINDFRRLMKRAVDSYPKLLTNTFELHENYKGIINEFLVSGSLMEPEHITACNKLYVRLQHLRVLALNLGSQIRPSSTHMWSSEGEDWKAGLINARYQVLEQLFHQLIRMSNELTDPFALINQVIEQGFNRFFIAFLKKHGLSRDLLPKLLSNDNDLDCLWTLCVAQINSSAHTGLKRLVELSTRCDNIVNKGDLLLPLQRGDLALMTDNELRSVNVEAKKCFAPFVISLSFFDSFKFRHKLDLCINHFCHWLMQNNSNPENLAAAQLLYLAEQNVIDVVQNDIDCLRQNQKKHLALMRTALNNTSANILTQLDQVEAQFCDPNVFPSVSDVLQFMLKVNCIVPVYDFRLMGLSSDYITKLEASSKIAIQL